ncbi:MAG: uroporphyrinogen-III C-methyltransferase [Raoultibacter sp.]
MTQNKKPHVFLVGAGPGDPGLLTVKGKKALKSADVLIYDRLVSPRLLELAGASCELIYVGKDPNKHTLPQHEINELIADKATGSNVVVRLKGGDPFVFGRGGEEAEVLRERGIEYDIVPGVTSAIAAPAYAGIPLTHRQMASSFTVITGHEHADKSESSIQWEHVAHLRGTLVFLMGMDNLSQIVGNLVEQGMDASTPVAVVHYGTWAIQKTGCGTLSTIETLVERQEIKNPSVIVVGQVAALREKLQWLERKPLFGKTIVVTRARLQASALSVKLEELGAHVQEFPAIEITPPSNPSLLVDAIKNLPLFQWVVFTSANGVEAFFAEADAQGEDARCLAGKQVVAIGSATQAALARCGIKQVFVPEEFCAEGIVALLADKLQPLDRVLIARAEEARDILPKTLTEYGAIVSDVAAYRTRAAAKCYEPLIEALREGKVDGITFTSSSTVRNLIESLQGQITLLEGIALYSIGPITSQTLGDFGLSPQVQADTYTIDGLVDAIAISQGGENELE